MTSCAEKTIPSRSFILQERDAEQASEQGQGLQDAPGLETDQDDYFVPGRARNPRALGMATIALHSSTVPQRPFPTALRLGPSSISLEYPDGGVQSILSGNDLESTLFRLPLSSLPASAREGNISYFVQGNTLFAVRVISSGEGKPSGQDTEESQRLLNRWASPEWNIDGGPIVFADSLLLATAEPSLVVLNKSDLSFQRTIPLMYSFSGLMVVLDGAAFLAALHRDGSIGLYTLSEATQSPIDPVEAFIQPEPTALESIRKDAAMLLSKDSLFSFSSIDLYGPRREVPADGAVLYRYGMDEESGSARMYIDGADGRPFLIAVYDDLGKRLATNVEYTAAAVLEARLEQGLSYFIAVSFLDAEQPRTTESGNGPSPDKIKRTRLVIAPDAPKENRE
jgi:hypothetical protein